MFNIILEQKLSFNTDLMNQLIRNSIRSTLFLIFKMFFLTLHFFDLFNTASFLMYVILKNVSNHYCNSRVFCSSVRFNFAHTIYFVGMRCSVFIEYILASSSRSSSAPSISNAKYNKYELKKSK